MSKSDNRHHDHVRVPDSIGIQLGLKYSVQYILFTTRLPDGDRQERNSRNGQSLFWILVSAQSSYYYTLAVGVFKLSVGLSSPCQHQLMGLLDWIRELLSLLLPIEAISKRSWPFLSPVPAESEMMDISAVERVEPPRRCQVYAKAMPSQKWLADGRVAKGGP